MTKQGLYDFISDIVICFYSKRIKISLVSLNAILKDRDSDYSHKKKLRQAIDAAYKYWEKRDPVVHHAIAYVFSDNHGKHAW
ncbi:MAG: hypothetical protein ACLQQ4_06530 [Bacteroidia bacterium]